MLFRIMLFQIDKSDVFNYLTVVLHVFHLGKKILNAVNCHFQKCQWSHSVAFIIILCSQI